MKAVRIHEYGAAPALEEVLVPDIGPDEVLVRVKAASLNPLDVHLQGGKMHGFFPLSVGPKTSCVVGVGCGSMTWLDVQDAADVDEREPQPLRPQQAALSQ